MALLRLSPARLLILTACLPLTACATTTGRPELVQGEARIIELHSEQCMALLETKDGRQWAFWDKDVTAAPDGYMATGGRFDTAVGFGRPPVATPINFPAHEGDRIVYAGMVIDDEIYLRRVAVQPK